MAHSFYVSITGVKQGKFKGEGAPKPHQGKIPGRSFEFEGSKAEADQPVALRDYFRIKTAKRRYKPVAFLKDLDTASPLLAAAMANHEMLSSVLFEFLSTRRDGGGEVVHHTIELKNAFVSHLKRYTSARYGYAGDEVEKVWLTFDTFEEQHTLAKTVAHDNWAGRGEAK